MYTRLHTITHNTYVALTHVRAHSGLACEDMYVHTHTHTDMFAHTYTCTCLHTDTFTHTQVVHTCTHAYTSILTGPAHSGSVWRPPTLPKKAGPVVCGMSARAVSPTQSHQHSLVAHLALHAYACIYVHIWNSIQPSNVKVNEIINKEWLTPAHGTGAQCREL